MGLKTSTIAITTYTITSCAGPQKRPVMAITSPREKAATAVPRRLAMPPTMTTAKHRIRSREKYLWKRLGEVWFTDSDKMSDLSAVIHWSEIEASKGYPGLKDGMRLRVSSPFSFSSVP
jgi:hypothetical protein